MDVGLFGGCDNFFFGGVRFSVGDVFAYGAAEEIDLLLDDADVFTETL